MKIGICEEHNIIREQLIAYCQKFGYYNITSYQSSEELLKSEELSSLNLLFLDIEMHQINGIEVKNAMEKLSPSTFIIFLTAHSEFMPDAFGKNVIYCLQKPVSEYDVECCLKKIIDLERELYTVSLNSTTSICCKDILYLHSEQKYTIFYTHNGKTFSSRKSLNAWEDVLLDLGFCRINRSYLINLIFAASVNQKKITLSTGKILPVSRRYSHQTITKYKNFTASYIQHTSQQSLLSK